MASKLNTKFVMGLSAALIVAAVGVGGSLYWIAKNNDKRLFSRGVEAYDKGDFVLAEQLLSKAVNKQRTNVQYLAKWKDALEKTTPDTSTKYATQFQLYGMLMRDLSVQARTDVAVHRAYLDLLLKQLTYGRFTLEGYESLAQAADTALNFFTTPGVTAQNGNSETLKRYRGIARTMIGANKGDNADAAVTESAIADLTAALVADPADADSAVMLSTAHTVRAAVARRVSDMPTADAQSNAAKTALQNFLKANPTNAYANMAMMELEYGDAARKIVETKVGPEALEMLRTLREDFKTRLPAIGDLVNASPVRDNRLMSQVMFLEGRIAPENRHSMSAGCMADYLTKHPEDFIARQMLADLYITQGKTDEALAELQKVVDLPRRPLSLDGLVLMEIQPNAMGRQVQVAMVGWDRASKPEDKTAAIAKAREYLTKFKGATSADNPMVAYVEGQLKFAEGDLAGAQSLLVAYNQQTEDTNADALWLLAQIHIRTNNQGEASRLLEKVVTLQPGNLTALNAQADIKARLRDLDGAEDIYQRVLQMDPKNAMALRGMEGINADRGNVNVDQKDPLLKAISEAQRAFKDGKEAEGMAALNRAVVESKYDPRVLQPLLARYGMANDLATAKELIEKAKVARPNDARIKALEIGLNERDPMKAGLILINEDPMLAPIEKAMGRHALYKQYDKKEEAAKALEEARAVDANDARVIEADFLNAIDGKDLAKARELAARAERENLDKVQGKTFIARVLFADGKIADALTMMQQAATAGTLGPEVWKIYARMQLQAGRAADSIPSYQRALEMRPDDPPTIVEMITVLRSIGRVEDALKEARQRERLSAGNAQFVTMMMDLEGQVGDKNKALEYRLKLLGREPENLTNRYAVALLRMDLMQFAEARTVIDGLVKDDPGLDSLVLDARWHLDQGDFAAGRRKFSDYIVNIDRDKMDADPYLVFARVMYEYKQVDLAFTLIDQSRRYQDPKTMPAERAFADLGLRLRRPDLSEIALRRIVDGGADTADMTYRRRLVENLNTQGKFKDAATFLAGLKADETDVVLLLLRADTANGSGDVTTAEKLSNEARTRFPNDPRVWVKAAQLLIGKPERHPEIEAFLARAIELDPQNATLFEVRGGWLIGVNRIDEGLVDLRRAVQLNPRLDNTRVALIREYVSRGRLNDAVEVAEAGIKGRENEVQLLSELGDVFLQLRQHSNAARFYKQCFELSRSAIITVRYLQCLLDGTPPNLNEAERVLKARQDDTDRVLELKTARAKLQFRRGRMDEARRDMVSALNLVQVDGPGMIQLWFDDMKVIYPKVADRARELDAMERETPVALLKDWLLLFRGMTLGEDAPNVARAAEPFRTLIGRTKSDLLKLNAFQRWSVALYLAERYPEAAEVMKNGIAAFPNDWELLNNASFTLAIHMNLPAEGLPFAEKALQLRPDSMDSIDTLGTIYMALGRLDDAEPLLRKAVDKDNRISGKVSALLHLAQLMVKKGDMNAAKPLVAEVEKLTTGSSGLLNTVQTKDLADLKSKIGSL
ncbi:MAG: tetratricopeptide repeat protein [Planctomycetes bacterium]|nr:tetratricopeptide repeat protein [Planctomycetota bacterium]